MTAIIGGCECPSSPASASVVAETAAVSRNGQGPLKNPWVLFNKPWDFGASVTEEREIRLGFSGLLYVSQIGPYRHKSSSLVFTATW